MILAYSLKLIDIIEESYINVVILMGILIFTREV